MRQKKYKCARALLAGLAFWAVGGAFGPIFADPAEQQSEQLSLEKLLNTKVSTASKYEQYVREAPASVTVITAEDIDRFGYRTLDEVLMSIPGFYVSYDRNYTSIGTRGFGRPADYNNRILLMVNGYALNEGVFGSAPIGADFGLDLGMIERIEIVRGPGSTLYGTSAVFAVLNIITKTGKDVDGLQMTAEAGNFGRKRGAVVLGKRSRRGLEAFFSGQITDIQGDDLYFNDYDAPEFNNGVAEGLDYEKNSGFFGSFRSGGFSLQGTAVRRKKGIPTGAWDVNFNDARSGTLDKRFSVESQYIHGFGPDKSLMIRGYYNHNTYEGWFPYGESLSADGSKDNRLGGEFRFRWDLGPANRLIAGIEYQNHLQASYNYHDETDTYIDGDWPFRIFSVYLQDEYQISDKFSATGGVRWDEYSNLKSHFSPRLGFVYLPSSSSSIKLLFGTAFRAPSPYEINIDDPISFIKPNFDLRPEVFRTMELSLEEKFSKNYYLSTSVYWYRMENLIDWVIDPLDSYTQGKNIGRVDAWGIEVGLNAQFGMEAKGYLNFSRQQTKDMVMSQRLTNSPAYLAKGGFTFPLLRYCFASVQAVYESGRLTLYGTKTEPFLLANVCLASRPIFGHLKFWLQIRNLLDAQYSYPGGWEHVQPAIIQDGRDISLKLAFSF